MYTIKLDCPAQYTVMSNIQFESTSPAVVAVTVRDARIEISIEIPATGVYFRLSIDAPVAVAAVAALAAPVAVDAPVADTALNATAADCLAFLQGHACAPGCPLRHSALARASGGKCGKFHFGGCNNSDCTFRHFPK